MAVYARLTNTEHGYDRDGENIKKARLVVGLLYEVDKIYMGQSSTSFTLKDCPLSFNSVNFDFWENGEKINIYQDKRFNPYIT